MATQQQLDNLKAVVPAAQLSMKLYGVPASVTLAQWILESGWGTTGLAKKANNCFGIKHSQKDGKEPYVEFPTHEYVAGKLVEIDADFVRYASVADSFKAHAQLLATAPRYKPAMYVAADPMKFALLLHACGYSTNPGYGGELMQIVRDYNLTQYDVPPPGAAAQQLKEAA